MVGAETVGPDSLILSFTKENKVSWKNDICV